MTADTAELRSNRPARARNATSPWLHAVMACGLVFVSATVGSLATTPNIPTWYAQIAKPSFTPPNWVFGPAWSILFTMMAVAFWRILRMPQDRPGRTSAITIFVVQLALNALWSVVFFGMQSPGWALVVIFGLETAILATIAAFWKVDRIAAWLLALYPLWVAYATALNIGIVLLNR